MQTLSEFLTILYDCSNDLEVELRIFEYFSIISYNEVDNTLKTIELEKVKFNRIVSITAATKSIKQNLKFRKSFIKKAKSYLSNKISIEQLADTMILFE